MLTEVHFAWFSVIINIVQYFIYFQFIGSVDCCSI